MQTGRTEMLEIGLQLTLTETVTEQNTAAALGSGGLDVYATPAMALLMEKTCYLCAQGALEAGRTTVGTALDIQHLSATPVSMQVVCTGTLIGVEDRALTFEVTCSDAAGVIGKGVHRRFIVDGARFAAKAQSKAQKQA